MTEKDWDWSLYRQAKFTNFRKKQQHIPAHYSIQWILPAQDDLYKDANSALDKVIQKSLIVVQALFVNFIMKTICEKKGILMVPATLR